MGILQRLFARPAPPPPPPTGPPWWLNMSGTTPIVGESFHAQEFRQILGPTADMDVTRYFPAGLRREPDNKHDRRAIAVHVAGLRVGHLARDATRDWHPLLLHIAAQGQPACCYARVWGGWNERAHSEWHSVQLCLSGPASAWVAYQPPPHATMLAPQKTVAVTREEHYQPALTGLLSTQRNAAAFATLDLADDPHRKTPAPAIRVAIGTETVGYLTAKMTDTYRHLVGTVGGSACMANVEISKRTAIAECKVLLPDNDETPWR